MRCEYKWRFMCFSVTTSWFKVNDDIMLDCVELSIVLAKWQNLLNIARRHIPITRTNIDKSFIGSCGIHLISRDVLKISISSLLLQQPVSPRGPQSWGFKNHSVWPSCQFSPRPTQAYRKLGHGNPGRLCRLECLSGVYRTAIFSGGFPWNATNSWMW